MYTYTYTIGPYTYYCILRAWSFEGGCSPDRGASAESFDRGLRAALIRVLCCKARAGFRVVPVSAVGEVFMRFCAAACRYPFATFNRARMSSFGNLQWAPLLGYHFFPQTVVTVVHSFFKGCNSIKLRGPQKVRLGKISVERLWAETLAAAAPPTWGSWTMSCRARACTPGWKSERASAAPVSGTEIQDFLFGIRLKADLVYEGCNLRVQQGYPINLSQTMPMWEFFGWKLAVPHSPRPR